MNTTSKAFCLRTPPTERFVKARNYEWRAVRCCCQPRKIFGFMQVESGMNHIMVEGKQFQIRVMSEKQTRGFGSIVGKYEDIQSVEYTRELAIYSEDHPIEFWRQQPGFIEAQNE